MDTIDFKHKENNIISLNNFNENKRRFKGQCALIYKVMLSGEKLTVKSAINKYKIGDLRRRVKDLRDIFGINVKSKRIGKTRYNEYFL